MSPPGVAFDHRLVQTGVIGHANSDHPVILPMDAHELDLWRKAQPNYTYWCGIQLGGCGGELSDKRYTDKVCHFAHHPSAPICHRTANGESSADHLFIKRGVQRLLDKEKARGTVETRNLGTGPGDAVDVHLPDSRRRLRFQLASLDHRAWRRAVDELAGDADDLDWVFGPDTPVTRDLVGRHGFCLRVRCETVGGERRVHIGAETQDRTIRWTPLDECALTPDGLSTPDVETIRLSLPRPKPPSFPILGSLVFVLVPEAEVPASSPFASEDRHLVMVDVKPTDSPIVRALLSLPGDAELPPAEHVYRVPDSGRMFVTEGGAWAIEANHYVRLNAHEAQRTGLWTPPPTSGSLAVAPVPPPRAVTTTAPQRTDKSEPEPSGLPHTSVVARASNTEAKARPTRAWGDLVVAVRDALAQSARLGTTTTWSTLVRTVGKELKSLRLEERHALLVEVDTPLRDNVPVLSAPPPRRRRPAALLVGRPRWPRRSIRERLVAAQALGRRRDEARLRGLRQTTARHGTTLRPGTLTPRNPQQVDTGTSRPAGAGSDGTTV
ncbi:hypothetical protein ACRAWF_38190 [Streptomyces sp. L7]